MKAPSLGALAVGLTGLTALVLIGVGAPSGRAPPESAATSSPAGPATVSAHGVSLASTSVDLPVDDQTYPVGPHADVVDANCASCHSPGMVLNQPALSVDQWRTEVIKMREIYRAPVDEKDVPAIIDYLVSLPQQNKPPANRTVQDPNPESRYDRSNLAG